MLNVLSRVAVVMVSALLLISFLGCSSSDKGGGAKHTFKMSGPGTNPNVEQGNEATAEITVNPDKNFNQNVRLAAKALTDGLTDVRLSKDTLTFSEGKKQAVTLTVKATPSAKVDTHVVRVSATPDVGETATIDVKFDVKQRREER